MIDYPEESLHRIENRPSKRFCGNCRYAETCTDTKRYIGCYNTNTRPHFVQRTGKLPADVVHYSICVMR